MRSSVKPDIGSENLLARRRLPSAVLAVADYDEAIVLKPDCDLACNERALVCAQMGRLGGQPEPAFLEALRQATEPAKRTQP